MKNPDNFHESFVYSVTQLVNDDRLYQIIQLRKKMLAYESTISNLNGHIISLERDNKELRYSSYNPPKQSFWTNFLRECVLVTSLCVTFLILKEFQLL